MFFSDQIAGAGSHDGGDGGITSESSSQITALPASVSDGNTQLSGGIDSCRVRGPTTCVGGGADVAAARGASACGGAAGLEIAVATRGASAS